MHLQEHIDDIENEKYIEMTSLIKFKLDVDGITILANETINSTATEAIIPCNARLSIKNEDFISAALALELRIYLRPSQSDNNKHLSKKNTNIFTIIKSISTSNHKNGDSITHQRPMQLKRGSLWLHQE